MTDDTPHGKWVYFKHDDLALTSHGPDRQLAQDILDLARKEGVEVRIKLHFGFMHVFCPDSLDDKIRDLMWCASLDRQTSPDLPPQKPPVYISKSMDHGKRRPPKPAGP